MLFRFRLILVLVLAAVGAPYCLAEPQPAAFITAIALHGADEAEGTAVRRGGKELRPRLLMPLFEGDEVFLRDSGSRILLETGYGTEQSVTGAGARFRIEGDTVADGGLWEMLGAVADAIGGESGEVAPDNMMSRDSGEALSIPMAVHGANYVVNDGRPLWLAWSGGEAPYRIRLAGDGVAAVHDNIPATAVSFELPKALPPRVRLTLEDAVGRRTSISLRLRERRPDAGFGAPPGRLAHDLAYAAWLTGVEEGRWSIEAARVLRAETASDASVLRLLAQIAAGWRVGQASVPQPAQ